MENPEDLDLDDTEALDRIIPKAAKKLVERGGVMFKPKKQTPYTGWHVEFWEDDAIEKLRHYRGGKLDGPSIWCEENGKWKSGNFKDGNKEELWIEWFEDGQKWSEGNYKDGERDGLWIWWHENGKEDFRNTYKDGEEVSHLQTSWYGNGQRKEERIYKDGKLISAIAREINGERCPHTNVVNGNGVMVRYKKDGGEDRRATYKDGELVED